MSSRCVRQIAALIQNIWWRWGWALNSDVREDCKLEAALVLWQAREKLAALPEAEQQRLASVCVRNRLRDLLRAELRHSAPTLSFEELRTREDHVVEVAAAPEWEALLARRLWRESRWSDLAAALHSLPAADRDLLELFYLQGLTDAEIARRRNARPATVKQQRHRVIGKLRKRLQPAEGDEVSPQ